MKKLSTFIFLLTILVIPRFIFAESLQLTTYYPAPFGVYEQLRLFPQMTLSGACPPGSLYVRDDTNTLQFCGSTATWGPLSGVWSQTGLFNRDADGLSDDVDVFLSSFDPANTDDPNIYVGIGTDAPESTLHIQDQKDSPSEGYAELRIQNTADQESSRIVFEEGAQGNNFEIRYHSQYLPNNTNHLEFWGIDKTDGPIMTLQRDYDGTEIQAVGIGVPEGYNAKAKLEVRNRFTEDILNLFDQSTEILTVTDGGVDGSYVGIGTTKPIAILTISGENQDIHHYSYDSSGPGSRADYDFFHASGSETTPLKVLDGFGLGSLRFSGYTGSANAGAAQILPKVDGPASLGNVPGRVEFRIPADYDVSSKEKMVIKSTGLVGIGETNPQAILHIKTDNNTKLFRLSSDGASEMIFEPQNDLDKGIQISAFNGLFQINEHSTGSWKSILSILRSNANFGIGTTAPRKTLQVTSQDLTNDHYSKLQGMIIEGNTAGLQIIGESASAWMAHLILSGSPTAAGNNKHWIISHWGPTGNNRFGIQYTETAATNFNLPNENNDMFTITTTGNVGIANTAPNVALDVTGKIKYSGSLTDVSDERLKENIARIEDPLSKLSRINGVYFNMIGSQETQMGVIAQEVQKEFPEVISYIDMEKDHLGVSYPNLIPVLIESVKELKKEVDQLKKESALRKERLKDLPL